MNRTCIYIYTGCVCVCVCVYMKRKLERGFKNELTLMWKCNSKIYRGGQQAGDPGKSCSLNPKAVSLLILSCSGEVSFCSIFRISTDWMKSIHIMESNLLNLI